MMTSSTETLKGRRSESPPWNPVRRIFRFMLMVSLVCTLIIVGVVLVALLLSHHRNHSATPPNMTTLLQVVPKPTRITPDSPRPLIRASRSQWRVLADEMDALLRTYDHPENASCSTCDLLRGISPNCTVGTNYGFPSGNPCVALLLLEHAFISLMDQTLVIECEGDDVKLDIVYSPQPRFQLQSLGAGFPPPLVMLQLLQPPIRKEIAVTCHLRSRDVGRASASFFIVVL